MHAEADSQSRTFKTLFLHANRSLSLIETESIYSVVILIIVYAPDNRATIPMRLWLCARQSSVYLIICISLVTLVQFPDSVTGISSALLVSTGKHFTYKLSTKLVSSLMVELSRTPDSRLPEAEGRVPSAISCHDVVQFPDSVTAVNVKRKKE